ncbi:MAG: 3-oxoacyl-[acyl-carrier-protein] reductase [Candidatus Marinimicrobia bacterium]|nr:3-oxoacyl-[acyl-carrier-protein] reductase [Candidatus Neomarinimicrobiota bacterium]
MNLNFKDKVVLVTGSGRGIGRVIAESFAENGATVILSDYNTESLSDAEQTFISKNYPYLALPCNVMDEEQVQKTFDQIIDKYAKIDIVINNAGITRDTLLMRMKSEQWNSVINTNLTGVFLVCKTASKYMMRQKSGKIINISSVVGVIGNVGQSNYSASKAGVIGFSKSIAKELAGRNITVNVIAPGFIETEMTQVLSDAAKEAFLSITPLKRAGNPKDVANMALFLASPMADYVTGQVIHVDGGMVM